MVLPIPSLFVVTPSNLTFNQLLVLVVLFSHKKLFSVSLQTIISGFPSLLISPMAFEKLFLVSFSKPIFCGITNIPSFC